MAGPATTLWEENEAYIKRVVKAPTGRAREIVFKYDWDKKKLPRLTGRL